MSLTYEHSSEPLHISAKQLVLRKWMLARVRDGVAWVLLATRGTCLAARCRGRLLRMRAQKSMSLQCDHPSDSEAGSHLRLIDFGCSECGRGGWLVSEAHHAQDHAEPSRNQEAGDLLRQV
jgi:hypothetical protein